MSGWGYLLCWLQQAQRSGVRTVDRECGQAVGIGLKGVSWATFWSLTLSLSLSGRPWF